jgi:hypothetical protein
MAAKPLGITPDISRRRSLPPSEEKSREICPLILSWMSQFIKTYRFGA